MLDEREQFDNPSLQYAKFRREAKRHRLVRMADVQDGQRDLVHGGTPL
jgi:hypothetical protein